METAVTYATERLDHLGIVAGVCREIGLAEFLDEQAKGSRQRVTIGTATVAMVLNGLGFSNRRLYLVPQFFENKPLGHLLGANDDIEAGDLNDDCLGRTLDWLHAHDVTRLFASIALRARRVFGIESSQIHVDTTSFSVHGEYESAPRGEEEAKEATIALTYGYSREHRVDLKQWMMALATTHEGDVPLLMRPLDGNSSDAHTLVAAVEALKEQLGAEEQEEEEETPIFVADAGIYGEENMVRLAEAGVEWVSRVPRTSTAASSLIEEVLDAPEHHWRKSEEDGDGGGVGLFHEARLVDLPQGRTERWVVATSEEGLKRAKERLERRLERHQQEWEKKLWHLSNRAFACQADAREALKEATKRLPECLEVVGEPTLRSRPRYAKGGRPAKDAEPATIEWRIEATLGVDRERVERESERRACYIVGTSVLDGGRLSEEELIRTYKGQGGVERGFRFLKDPLFLASSVFVKKPERIEALGFVMVVCLLVYRLAEQRLRERLAQSEQTVPNQVGKPITNPTMRWVFQFFEGIDVLYVRSPAGVVVSRHVLHLRAVHEQVLRLLGPPYQKLYDVPI